MTALAEAFKDAGVKTPQQRLRDAAFEAFKAHPTSWDKSKDAFFNSIRNDAGLLWALFKPYRVQAVNALLRDVVSDMKNGSGGGSDHSRDDTQLGAVRSIPPTHSNTGRAPVGGGQFCVGTQAKDAPATSSPDHARPQALRAGEPTRDVVTPSNAMSARPTLKELADKQRARMETNIVVQIRLSRLDTVMIGDQPIGSCTVAQVREWAELRWQSMAKAGRDWRFACALVANLPSGAIIRDYWKNPDEIEQIYLDAEAQYAA